MSKPERRNIAISENLHLSAHSPCKILKVNRVFIMNGMFIIENVGKGFRSIKPIIRHAIRRLYICWLLDWFAVAGLTTVRLW